MTLAAARVRIFVSGEAGALRIRRGARTVSVGGGMASPGTVLLCARTAALIVRMHGRGALNTPEAGMFGPRFLLDAKASELGQAGSRATSAIAASETAAFSSGSSIVPSDSALLSVRSCSKLPVPGCSESRIMRSRSCAGICAVLMTTLGGVLPRGLQWYEFRRIS